MATPEQIAQLRLLIAEPDNTAPYDDASLGLRIDAAQGELPPVAYDIWVEKAAAAAQLVDTSEGGSSRKMGDIHEQSLAMASHFKKEIEDGEPQTDGVGVRIRKLRRP